MVWCKHCGKNVPGIRPEDSALACNICGRILENFIFSTEVTFVKNAAGQSKREPDHSSVVSKSEKRCSFKGEGGKDGDDEHSEASDESDNFSDISDTEVDCYINHTEEEKRYKKLIWEHINKEYIKEQADKEAAANDALNASKSSCPEHARKLVVASKAAVAKSRKEKKLPRAEEAKNMPPPATAMVPRTLDEKRLSRLIGYDVLEELFGTPTAEEPPKRSKKRISHGKEEGRGW